MDCNSFVSVCLVLARIKLEVKTVKKIFIIFIPLLFLCSSIAYADQNDYLVGRAAGYKDGLSDGLTNMVKMSQNSKDSIKMAGWYGNNKNDQSQITQSDKSTTAETPSETNAWFRNSNQNQDQIEIPEPSYIPGKSVQYQNGYKDGWKEGYIKGYKNGMDGGNEGFLLGGFLGVFGVIIAYLL